MMQTVMSQPTGYTSVFPKRSINASLFVAHDHRRTGSGFDLQNHQRNGSEFTKTAENTQTNKFAHKRN